MLKRLFRPRDLRAQPAAVPAGERLYAIGDVHGRLDLLDDLLARIAADDAARSPATTTMIFLGDLVDRGPSSAAVVERVRTLAAARGDRVRVLLGNHEEVMLAALEGPREAVRTFCRIGGRETILSYGLSAADYEAMDYADVASWLAANVPPSHRTFLARLEAMVVVGDYAFVHAGIRPGRPLEEQRASDLRWIREPFLSHQAGHEKVIVHGHTIVPAIDFGIERIGIDTGAYATGRLTALALEGAERWALAT